MPSKLSSAGSQRQATTIKSRSATDSSSNGSGRHGLRAGSGQNKDYAELPKRQENNLSRTNSNRSTDSKAEEVPVIETELPRAWEELRAKVIGWELAHLLDDETEIFDDDDMPDKVVQKWEWLSRLVISNEVQLKARHQEQNMVSSFAKVLNTGMGAEGSQSKAEMHYKRGKQLYDMGEFNDAVKEYKEASNWYFKGGERRLRCIPLHDANVHACMNSCTPCVCVCSVV
jgi:hypothetical protein